MVGGKSLGCKTCKKRRIKCDERRPICRNCERGGRQCSGALSPFQHYQVLTVPREESYTQEERALPNVGAAQEGKYSSVPDDSVKLDQRILKTVPSSPQASLAQSLADSLRNAPSGIRLQFVGQFFDFIPSRIGHLPFLDAAADCVLQCQKGLVRPQLERATEALHSYGTALNLIRQEITRLEYKRLRPSAELIAAVMMLATYSIIGFQDLSRPYQIHVGGVSDLVQAWGPQSVKSDFDHAIFDTHYGQVTATALIWQKKCFVTDPKWHALCERSQLLRSRREEHYFFDNEVSLARVPAMLREVRYARLQSQSGELRPSALLALIHQAKDLRETFLQAGQGAHLALSDPSVLVMTPVSERMSAGAPSTLYHYSSKYVALNSCHYWACMILANRLLTTLLALPTTPPTNLGSLAATNEGLALLNSHVLVQGSSEYAGHISSSLPFFRSHAPLGTLNMIFACQLAVLVCDGERKAWIVREVGEQLGTVLQGMTAQSLELAGKLMTGGDSPFDI